MAYLLVRNYILGIIFYGGWFYFLYELGPIKAKVACEASHPPYAASLIHPGGRQVKNLKFNPKYPSYSQHRRDAFWTTSGLTISTVFEAVMYHAWASGAVPYYANFWQFPLWCGYSSGCLPFVPPRGNHFLLHARQVVGEPGHHSLLAGFPLLLYPSPHAPLAHHQYATVLSSLRPLWPVWMAQGLTFGAVTTLPNTFFFF